MRHIQHDEAPISDSDEIPLSQLSGILKQGLDYWTTLASADRLPSWRDVDLMALPARAIAFVTVVDVRREPPDFVYRFWGTGHVEAKGIDRTGESVNDHPQGRSGIVLTEYRKVVEERRPIAFRRLVRLPEPKLPLNQVSVRMPLSNDGTCVDGVFSVCDWLSLKHLWNELWQPPAR